MTATCLLFVRLLFKFSFGCALLCFYRLIIDLGPRGYSPISRSNGSDLRVKKFVQTDSIARLAYICGGIVACEWSRVLWEFYLYNMTCKSTQNASCRKWLRVIIAHSGRARTNRVRKELMNQSSRLSLHWFAKRKLLRSSDIFAVAAFAHWQNFCHRN